MKSRVRPWMLVIGLLAAAACGDSAATKPAPTFALHHPSVAMDACIGTGAALVVRGSASDPEVAWVEPLGGGERSLVAWPDGYMARFAPQLEILDASGRVLLREEDFIGGTCGSDMGGRLLLAPPFLALRLDCGPVDRWTCPIHASRAATAAGWPQREIASIRFTSSDGEFVLMYEDGSSVSGKV